MQYPTFLSVFVLFILQSIFNIQQSFAQTPNSTQEVYYGIQNKQGSPFIRNYTPEEYKNSPQNWAITQDKRGVMYFGNSHGVIEFDGKNWELIEVSNNSVVRSLSINKNGTIFVGALNEFGYLASDPSGKLIYISLRNMLNEQDKNFNDIWKIYSTTHGIYFLSAKKIFRYYNDSINILPSEYSSNNGYLVNDELFVVKRDSGMYIVKGNVFKLLPFTEEFTSGFGRIAILPYTDKKILIGTQYKGFYIYDFGEISSIDGEYNNVLSSVLKKFNTEIDEYINHHDLYGAVTINNNRYAFATLSGGIIIMDKNGKLIRVINKNRGLQNNSINNLFVDRNQNLWAASDNGISEIEISSPISKFDKSNGLEDLVLSVIMYNGKIYANTLNGIFYLPDYKMNIIDDKYNFKHISNTRLDCWDFISVKNTKRKYDFLLASVSQGFVQIHDTLAEELYQKEKIYSFYQSKKFPDHIFLGLANGFAYLEIMPAIGNQSRDVNNNKTTSPFSKNNAKLKFIYHEKFNHISDLINNIVSDDKGDLWLSAIYNGIIHIEFPGQDISDFHITRYDTSDGLPKLDYNYVYYINNNIVVATQKGIYKAILSSGTDSNDTIIKFVPETTFGKIFNEYPVGVTQIYTDTDDKILVFSDIGIGKLTKGRNEAYKLDPVPFKKISTGSTYKIFPGQNGLIWISTIDGLLLYDPKIKKNYDTQFHSLIRKVTLGKDSVIFYGTNYNDSLINGSYYISASLKQPRQLIPLLKYENNSMTFEFSTTFYEKGSANRFKYILQGFDKDWSNWTDETKKEYTNLPEGTYYFKVIAKNVFEYESTEATYKFTILPPWYRTIIAYITYVLMFIVIFIIGVKLNTRRLKAANIRLELIVKERTSEILQQKSEIQNQAKQLEVINIELEKLSIVASETDNAVLIMDAKGNCEWINEGYKRMYGYTLEQLIEKKGNNIIDFSANPDINTIINNCIVNKKTIIYETLLVTNTGHEIWAQTTLTPILNINGNVIKIVAIDSDITKIKKAEEEIQLQSNLLEKKNILITDSIRYAQLIQEALFPSEKAIKRYLPDLFIFFEPKDIVSGDFYWFSEQEGKLFIAVVDCTGHGVPGAFMSMLGIAFLNEIIRKEKNVQPNQALEKLRNYVKESLHQTERNDESHDGMDISLCMIDIDNLKMDFAGAHNSVYLIRKNKEEKPEIIVLEADPMPIGVYIRETPFKNTTIQLKSNDCIYLFSDGYISQFGGKNNAKFMSTRFNELLLNIYDKSMKEQKAIIKSTFIDWKGTNFQVDDILVMGFRIG